MSGGTLDRKFLVTVDVEEDISNYLTDSYLGVLEGLPWLLDLLKEAGLKACFFLLGHICEKFPDIAKRIADEGHQIGAHGLVHETLYYKGSRWQTRQLSRATQVITTATGVRPRLFRATKFSATDRTLRVLEKLGYSVDSSILPGTRATILRGKITVRTTFGVPREPYHPDRHDILRPGDSPVWEVPLTESPIFRGAPIGMGGLNTFGVSKMKAALSKVTTRHVIFLIHPWECVDLGAKFPGLKDWVKKLCARNKEGLWELLSHAEDAFELGNFDLLRLNSAVTSFA